ncbi:hypothetical protein PY257_14730 [Ramlibacter sp. H39-3-26]|uniref:hypothetical protein n=1 Tax=Curvibacter soli TaxID=3031331 RepID=UPI0023DB586D|nr:hypothetical protein [Ramlibacter sp. H39-3-26]MDF1486418.1 hypothetical protein [Ramlibacter sp. H39-3-26]
MTEWTPYPYAGEYVFDTDRVRACWPRLHAGDAEPCPAEPAVLGAWALYHSGEYQKAAAVGLALGGAAVHAAYQATAVHAAYVERHAQTRHALLRLVADRATAHAQQHPRDPAGWYWQAYALGHHSQGISVAQALAQGLGGRIRLALQTAIELEPAHADARFALGTYHAEVIDKVGTLIGGMTHGASKEDGLRMFREGLALHPGSVFGMLEYAGALLMLEGESQHAQATRLYEQAAACTPLDATERIGVELAQAALRE